MLRISAARLPRLSAASYLSKAVHLRK